MVNIVGKLYDPGKKFYNIFQKPPILGMVECVSSFDIERDKIFFFNLNHIQKVDTVHDN